MFMKRMDLSITGTRGKSEFVMVAYMKNSNYSKAKALTLIPIIILAVTVICMVLADILEAPTSRGAIYTAFAFAGLMSILLSPLPCLVMTIIGTVFATRAKKYSSSPKDFCTGYH